MPLSRPMAIYRCFRFVELVTITKSAIGWSRKRCSGVLSLKED